MVTIQNYVRAGSLEEAYELNQKRTSLILGGMLWTKMQNRRIQTAIDLCDLGLDRIEENEEEFSIGAMVSLRQLELHAGLNEYTHGAVKNAVKDIVGVQFRNLATVGGSIWGRFGFSDVLTVFLAMDTYVELFCGGLVPLREKGGMFCIPVCAKREYRFSGACMCCVLHRGRIPSECRCKTCAGNAASGRSASAG